MYGDGNDQLNMTLKEVIYEHFFDVRKNDNRIKWKNYETLRHQDPRPSFDPVFMVLLLFSFSNLTSWSSARRVGAASQIFFVKDAPCHIHPSQHPCLP